MDVAFLRAPLTKSEGVVIHPLCVAPMVVAVPTGHRLALKSTREALPLKELAGEVFVVYAREQGPAIHAATVAACLTAGFTPQLGQEAPRVTSALSLVAAGLGVSIVNPALYAAVPYDPHRDFRAVTVAVSAPTVLSVHPSIAVESVEELINLIRSSPGRFSYASPGTGTPPHLIGEQFRLSLGLDLVHVPFNGAGQAVASTLAGHTAVAFSALPAAVSLIKEGKLRGLAVTGPSRAAVLSDLPTMAEQGHPEIDGEGWFAFVAPTGTPDELVMLLYREITAALSRPDMSEKLSALGFEAVNKTPEQSAKFFRSEGERWTAVIRSAGIKAE